MQRIGGNRERRCFTNDVPLIGDKGEGQRNGNHHNEDAGLLRQNLFGMQQPLPGLKQQKGGGAGNDCRLEKPGQRFRFAMTETVIAICRNKRLTNGEEIDQGCRKVKRAVHQC